MRQRKRQREKERKREKKKGRRRESLVFWVWDHPSPSSFSPFLSFFFSLSSSLWRKMRGERRKGSSFLLDSLEATGILLEGEGERERQLFRTWERDSQRGRKKKKFRGREKVQKRRRERNLLSHLETSLSSFSPSPLSFKPNFIPAPHLSPGRHTLILSTRRRLKEKEEKKVESVRWKKKEESLTDCDPRIPSISLIFFSLSFSLSLPLAPSSYPRDSVTSQILTDIPLTLINSLPIRIRAEVVQTESKNLQTESI